MVKKSFKRRWPSTFLYTKWFQLMYVTMSMVNLLRITPELCPITDSLINSRWAVNVDKGSWKSGEWFNCGKCSQIYQWQLTVKIMHFEVGCWLFSNKLQAVLRAICRRRPQQCIIANLSLWYKAQSRCDCVLYVLSWLELKYTSCLSSLSYLMVLVGELQWSTLIKSSH